MVSTFTAQKAHLEQPGSGDYIDVWASPININWNEIDACFGGNTTLNLTGLSGVITLSTSQAQVLRILLTGTPSGSITVQTPASVGGFWIIDNESTAAVLVTTATGGSTGVSVPSGRNMVVNTDGNNIESATDSYLQLSGGTLTGTVNMASNGLNVGSGQLVVSGGNVSTSGSITAAGDVTAFSDLKWKEDIQTIPNALALVQSMRGVTFYWKKEISSEKGRRAGVIAQEIEKVFPEVITKGYGTNNEEGLYVAYGNLTAVLIEAVKELTERVAILEMTTGKRD